MSHAIRTTLLGFVIASALAFPVSWAANALGQRWILWLYLLATMVCWVLAVRRAKLFDRLAANLQRNREQSKTPS